MSATCFPLIQVYVEQQRSRTKKNVDIQQRIKSLGSQFITLSGLLEGLSLLVAMKK